MKRWLLGSGWLVSLALILVGAGMQYGLTLDSIPGIEWIAARGPLSVCLIEETSQRTALTREQQAVLESLTFRAAVGAKGTFIAAVDKDIVGPDKQPPAVLQPFLDAAKGQKLPVVAYRRGTGKIVVAPLVSEADAKRRLGL